MTHLSPAGLCGYGAPMSPRAVIVISSHVARGMVGARAATLALEALGRPVWAVHTLSVPWHPGHAFRRGETVRMVPSQPDFEALLSDLAGAPWLPEVGAVLTGYMATPAQVEATARFVERVRERGILHVCDPVMGDAPSGETGGLYVPRDVAEAMRDRLVPLADVATPNRFELRWLSGRVAPFETNEEVIAAARALGPARVLVTSALPVMRGATGNLFVGDKAWMAEHRALPDAPNGTGDLTAALLTHHVLAGASPRDALERTTATTFAIVARSVKQGSDELRPQGDRADFVRPMAPVGLREMVG